LLAFSLTERHKKKMHKSERHKEMKMRLI